MKSRFTLGVLTLGQAPRRDVEPTLRSILGPDVVLEQRGGLDGLTPDEVAGMAPAPGEPGIETCLVCGGRALAVMVSREALLPRLITAARELESRCDAFFLLCSGHFPELKRAVPGLVEPVVFIRAMVAALAGKSHLCVMGPASDMTRAPAQWGPYAARVSTVAVSPYDSMERVVDAANSARKTWADFILLDDMGFTADQRRMVRTVSGITTLNATSITARLLGELI